MKKIIVWLMIAIVLTLSACTNFQSSDLGTESVPTDYSLAIELAQKEFGIVFAEYSELEIINTSTMSRTDKENHIVIQISFTSNNGDGVYGFELQKDKYGNWDILQQGEDVTIDIFVK